MSFFGFWIWWRRPWTVVNITSAIGFYVHSGTFSQSVLVFFDSKLTIEGKIFPFLVPRFHQDDSDAVPARFIAVYAPPAAYLRRYRQAPLRRKPHRCSLHALCFPPPLPNPQLRFVAALYFFVSLSLPPPPSFSRPFTLIDNPKT